MAYASNPGLSGLAGVVGGAIGGYLGYTYAGAVDMPPVQGALVLGGIGFVLGGAGAFLLKSAVQFIIYLVLIFALLYVFHDQVEALVGIDPVDALNNTLRGFGFEIPVIGENKTYDEPAISPN